MNILYVRKQERGPIIKARLRLLRDSYTWHNREGFFCASLGTKTSVTRAGLNRIQGYSKSDFRKFDAIIFNYECNFIKEGYPIQTVSKAVKELYHNLTDIPIVLLISNPNAKLVPSEEDMDLFDLVFRREHFKDLDRYNLSSRSKEKLRTTVLSCPLIPANRLNFKRIDISRYGHVEPSTHFNNDVFFLGQETSKKLKRTEVIKFIKQSGLNFTGGIHPDVRNPQQNIPDSLYSKRLSKKKFYEKTRTSKINLALGGYGQFTYRHWECWALSSFMISSPSVNQVKLPFEAIDGKHYVTFDNKNDLVDKIRYYRDHTEEREEIVRNARNLFVEEYNFQKHGEYILNSLKQIM